MNSMTDNEIVIEVAKLDGWTFKTRVTDKAVPYSCDVYQRDGKAASLHTNTLPKYLTSQDAIIPVIEKCILPGDAEINFSRRLHFEVFGIPLNELNHLAIADAFRMFIKATPKQLCIALLKAVGKWEE